MGEFWHRDIHTGKIPCEVEGKDQAVFLQPKDQERLPANPLKLGEWQGTYSSSGPSKGTNQLTFFKNPHPRICLLLIFRDSKKEGRRGRKTVEREREMVLCFSYLAFLFLTSFYVCFIERAHYLTYRISFACYFMICYKSKGNIVQFRSKEAQYLELKLLYPNRKLQ